MKIKDLLTALYILIILSFLITITAVLCNQWKYSYTPCDNLSKNYKDYVIRATKDSDIEEFIAYLSSNCDEFRLQKQTNKGYTSIYLKNHTLDLDLLEGRQFSEGDFKNNKNVVMIAEPYLKNTYKEGTKKYIVIEKNVYEVIGVFSKKENPVNPNTDIFINMTSEQFLNTNNQIDGRYYFDSAQDLIAAVTTKYNIKENKTIYKLGISKHIQLVTETLFLSWKILLCIAVFLILSLMFLFVLWLTNKKRIILVNYICGATKDKLFFLLLRKWLLINLCSIIVSMTLGTVILICKHFCFLFGLLYIMYGLFSGAILLFFINNKIKELR